MWQDILDFNNAYPYNDTTRLLHEKDNKKGQVVSIPPRMGISDEDCVTAARLILTSYALDNLDTIGRHILQFIDSGDNPDGKAIDDFFTPGFLNPSSFSFGPR